MNEPAVDWRRRPTTDTVALIIAVLACLAKEPSDRPDSAWVLDEQLAGAVPADAAWTARAAREWWDVRRVVVNPGERAVTGTRADATTAPAMGRCWPKVPSAS
jgi:hypothetical protein